MAKKNKKKQKKKTLILMLTMILFIHIQLLFESIVTSPHTKNSHTYINNKIITNNHMTLGHTCSQTIMYFYLSTNT